MYHRIGVNTMKLIKTHNYRFPNWLLPALINGDPIIDKTDREGFEAFINKLEQYKIDYNASHYIIDYEPYSYFSHTNCLDLESCDVTDIKVYFFK